MLDPTLQSYIEENILPQYDRFDAAHDRAHVSAVIAMSLALGRETGAEANMVYAIAAYHDLGLPLGRAEHHLHSARLFLADAAMRRWFDGEQRQIMSAAIEDHRASGGAPRSLYGKIVADADRELDPARVLYRTLAYGRSHYPQLGRAEQIERAYAHIREKYGPDGYLRLWLNGRENERRLAAVRAMLLDRAAFEARCLAI